MTKNEKAAAAAPAPQQYRALVGFNYPNRDPEAPKGSEIRVEAGEVGPLPDWLIAGQLAQHAIEPFPPPAPAPAGALTVAEDAGAMSLAQDGELSEGKE